METTCTWCLYISCGVPQRREKRAGNGVKNPSGAQTAPNLNCSSELTELPDPNKLKTHKIRGGEMNAHRISGCAALVLFCGLGFFWAAEEKKAPPIYTVAGERHGVSFFPLVDYPETRPRVEGEMDFFHYHKYAEVISFLKAWAKDHPDTSSTYIRSGRLSKDGTSGRSRSPTRRPGRTPTSRPCFSKGTGTRAR